MLKREFHHLSSQQTIAAPAAFTGIAPRSRRRVMLQVLPAPVNHGIVIMRCDLPEGENRFAAEWSQVVSAEGCTMLGNASGHHVGPIEHLMSALFGLGLDNALVVMDGPEVPVMDGSALPFVSGLTHAGVTSLDHPRDVLVVRRAIRLESRGGWAAVLPDRLPRITLSTDHGYPGIRHQSLSLFVSPTIYLREIAPARTFGLAEQLWHQTRYGEFDDESRRDWSDEAGQNLDDEGVRYPDEFVRHKALDLLGDLALCGLPIIGHIRTNQPDHRLTNDLIKLLMSQPDDWQRVAGSDLIDGRVQGLDQYVMGAGIDEFDRQFDETVRPSYEGPVWRNMMTRWFGRSGDGV
jgi:UDP-3-O-[3-hydroxymyristoyl] N-acetylglucosamine deacetylase